MEGTKKEFFKKYPDADSRRIVFREIDGKVVTYYKIGNSGLLDITYDTFLRTPGFTKYLTNFKERGFGIWFADGTVQPYKKNKNHIEENKFKMYVTDNEYFTANFTPFSITNTLSTDYKKNPIRKISLLSLPRTCPPMFVEKVLNTWNLAMIHLVLLRAW
jgi:hypothetical protein